MIPKIIHQTWKNTDLPPDFKQSRESWIKHHPNWTYILWTDEMNRKFIEQYFPWFLKYFDNYEYNIQRADVIRYFILWKYGGLYSDMDVLAQRSFDGLVQELEQKGKTIAVVASGNLQNHASNWLMISTAANDFWKEVWNNLISSHNNKDCEWCYGKHLKVMYSTGPGLLNYTIKYSPGTS